MGQTTFSGPVRAGTIKEGGSANVGNVVLSQTATFTVADTGAFASGIILPAGCQIVDQIVDVDTAWNSATSDALEIGTAADPDAYGDVASIKTATGRTVVDPDATQVAAIDDIGTADVPVYLKITSVGTPTTGSARLTITYVQK